MFKILKGKSTSAARVGAVGWLLNTEKASVIWDAPRKISRDDPPIQHAKAVGRCPAVLDHEARLFEIPCAVDISLRLTKRSDNGELALVNAAGDQSTIRSKHLNDMVTLIARKEWRHPDRPVLQISTPYLFVADEPVYMTQLPAISHFRKEPLPGVQIGGRFPIHIWPRTLMWAFEWHDTQRELNLNRGEPWFYVRFETEDPSRPVRMVEAELTPQLKEYMSSVSSVTNYVNRTFSLFATARERRPKTLLVPKQR